MSEIFYTYFSEFFDTAVTDNDWVCDLVTRPTDLFTYGCVGLILGTALFSWLADAKGRKPAFYFSTILMVIFQLTQVGVSHSYPAFLAMKILSFACMLPMFQTPMGIVTEISNSKGQHVHKNNMLMKLNQIIKFSLKGYKKHIWKTYRCSI